MGSLGTLRQLALKLTRNQADADDLLQATCLRALETASKLRDYSNLAGWLTRVMRNLQIDASRSRARRMVPLTDRQVAACAPEGIAVWRQIDDDDLAELLPRLSPQLRAVWDLHHDGGLDQNAIATRLGIPRTTVATRLFRARLALRTSLLKRHGVDATIEEAEAPERPTKRRPGRPRLKLHRGGVPAQLPAPTSLPSRQPKTPASPAPAPERPLASAL